MSEPGELDLLADCTAVGDAGRPFEEAFRLLAPPASARIPLPTPRLRAQLWIDQPALPRRPWTAGAVRRFVDTRRPATSEPLVVRAIRVQQRIARGGLSGPMARTAHPA
jgi:hypothetical protein